MSNLLALKDWGFYIVLGVILVGGFVLMYFKNKKEQKQREENKQKLDSLPIGTEILTIGMIKGSIVKNESEYVVLSTGDEENKGFITIHKNGIYRVLSEEAMQESQTASEKTVKDETIVENVEQPVEEKVEKVEENVVTEERETPAEDEISD